MTSILKANTVRKDQDRYIEVDLDEDILEFLEDCSDIDLDNDAWFLFDAQETVFTKGDMVVRFIEQDRWQANRLGPIGSDSIRKQRRR